MNKTLPYNKIIITSTFIKTADSDEKSEKLLNMVVDMLKNINK